MKHYNVVDSSGWLEYLSDSDRAHFFAEALEDTEHLLVPVITIYEIFKKVLRERGEGAALQVAAQMQSGEIIPLDQDIALEAAKYQLPLADSVIYATAQRYKAVLWTQDEDFKDLEGVRYYPKR